MPTPFQKSSAMVLAMLRNARRQAIGRQNRRLAMDVLKACSLYIKGTNFPCDPEIFERLASTIIDKQNQAIMEEFAKVEKSLTDSFSAAERGSWRAIKLPR